MDEPHPSPSDVGQDANRPLPVARFDSVARAYLKPLRDRLERIESWLKAGESVAIPSAVIPPTPEESPTASTSLKNAADVQAETTADSAREWKQVVLHIQQQLNDIRGELRSLREDAHKPDAGDLNDPSTKAAATARNVPECPGPPFAVPARLALPIESLAGEWDEVILGAELCGRIDLAAHRDAFLRDFFAGEAAARTLAGQLLLLHAANAEELPERLRHVGEAYYRWRPRASTAEDSLETALAEMLTARAEAAGLRNSIQLVRPGDRFDSTRHVASGRGLEISEVHGWVVLRDQQKVYTKAAVTVK